MIEALLSIIPLLWFIWWGLRYLKRSVWVPVFANEPVELSSETADPSLLTEEPALAPTPEELARIKKKLGLKGAENPAWLTTLVIEERTRR